MFPAWNQQQRFTWAFPEKALQFLEKRMGTEAERLEPKLTSWRVRKDDRV